MRPLPLVNVQTRTPFPRLSDLLIKMLWHDGQGMCLFAKRLEWLDRPRGSWRPKAGDNAASAPLD
jgi:hypothetical protein